jgi:dienelactone hydrolase
VKACSTYYPTLRDHVAAWALDATAEARDMRAPVQIHYPQLDSVTPYATIVQMRSALEARPGTPTTITCCYAQAHHGFLSRNPERDPADRLATQLAWPATIAFYRATLLQASPIEQPARAELGVKG